MVLYAMYYQTTYASLTAVLLFVSTHVDWMADKIICTPSLSYNRLSCLAADELFYFTLCVCYLAMVFFLERVCQIDLYQVADLVPS